MADPIIRQIVGRCHVGQSNRQVIREIVKAIKGKHKGWIKNPKEMRKEAMRQAIQLHKENRELYFSVMSGRF